MRDLDSIFDELAAHAKMPRNLIGAAAGSHKAAQRRVWNQRGGAYCIRGFFIVMIVVASEGAPRRLRSILAEAGFCFI